MLARVRLNYLRSSDVHNALGDNVSTQSKEQFIERWVEDKLWEIEAKKHVRLNKEIRGRVDEYRMSLLIREYKTSLILNSILIDENDILKYYNEHRSEFLANRNAAFIEIYSCTGKQAADEVLTKLKNSVSPTITAQLRLVYRGDCIDMIDKKLFERNPKKLIGPIDNNGNFFVISVVERYSENTLFRLEHVREDIIQKLRMSEYSNAIQQKHKELKDRINVKIY